MKAIYRKWNDRSNSSSTYHKKDGTNVRQKLKMLLLREMKDYAIISTRSVEKPGISLVS